MRTLLTVLLFAYGALAQTPAKTVPQQGPPPKHLTQGADGHFTANPDPENAEKFEVHVVEKGETLSAISAVVLKNPRLWPQTWEQNEHIINPHWIYPNDKILIRPVTQITEATPPEPPPPPAPPEQTPEPPRARAVPPPPPAQPAPAPVFQLQQRKPVSEIKPQDLYCSGFVRRAEVPKDLLVISKLDVSGGVLSTDSEYVYLSHGSEDGITTGTMYQVIRPTTTITNPVGQTSEQRDLGTHYLDIAQLSVVMTQPDFSLARVIRTCADAIQVGDIMLPFQPLAVPSVARPREFSPTMTVSGDVKGSVVISQAMLLNFGSSALKTSGIIPGVRGGRLASLARGVASEGEIVYIDAGEGQGVKPGDVFVVYRNLAQDKRLYNIPKEAKKLKDVRTAVGELVVLKVEERASTALVTYASDGLSLGDAVERK